MHQIFPSVLVETFRVLDIKLMARQLVVKNLLSHFFNLFRAVKFFRKPKLASSNKGDRKSKSAWLPRQGAIWCHCIKRATLK